MDREPKKFAKLGKKALAAAAALVAACSVALAVIAPAPADLSGESAPVAAIAQALPVEEIADAETPRRRERFRARLSRAFLARPSALRGLILLPFWALGKALLALFSALLPALSPLWQALLGVLLNALLLFGLFAALYRLIFPDRPLHALFTKRNVLLLAGGAALLAAADAVLRAYWADYRPISVAIKLILALAVLIALSRRIHGRRTPPEGRAAA